MQKMLYISPFGNINEWTYSFMKEFEKYYEVYPFDYRRMYSQNIDVNKIISNIINILKPDITFVLKGELINPDYINSFKVVYAVDDMQYYSHQLIDMYNKYDCVFTPNKKMLSCYDNSCFLPYAYDPKVYYPLEVDKDIDVSFIGTAYKNRYDILKELIYIDDVNIKIYGDGWSKYNIDTYRSDTIEQLLAFNRSRITLNVYQEFMKNCGTISSTKIFEALGCKTFVITDEIEGMKKYFKDGKHLVYFKTIDDLKEKICKYIHDIDRYRIAENGYNEVVNNHTIEKRVSSIIDII